MLSCDVVFRTAYPCSVSVVKTSNSNRLPQIVPSGAVHRKSDRLLPVRLPGITGLATALRRGMREHVPSSSVGNSQPQEYGSPGEFVVIAQGNHSSHIQQKASSYDVNHACPFNSASLSRKASLADLQSRQAILHPPCSRSFSASLRKL